jgi:chorismate mutase
VTKVKTNRSILGGESPHDAQTRVATASSRKVGGRSPHHCTQIDKLDVQIVKLINERAHAAEIGRLKNGTDGSLYAGEGRGSTQERHRGAPKQKGILDEGTIKAVFARSCRVARCSSG